MALTRYFHDHGTLVGQYLYQRYANTAPVVRVANRPLAALPTTHPGNAHHPWAVAARAIGLRLRAEFAPLSVGKLVAARGAHLLTSLPEAPYPQSVATALLDDLGAITQRYHEQPRTPLNTERLDCVCAVLALLEDLARTRRLAESALAEATVPRTLAGWLTLPTPALLSDIHTMATNVITQQPLLFGQPGVSFPRLGPLRGAGGALDPILVGGTLYLIKATTQPAINGTWLRELVGYGLLDLDDHYGITRVGVILPRQGATVAWPLGELAARLAGSDDLTLHERRQEFAQVRLIVGEPLATIAASAA